MAIYDDGWFEVWYSDGQEIVPYHLLVVTVNLKSKEIIVIDPLKDNMVVFRAAKYEEVCSWLWADEYDLIEGRVFPDDGFSSSPESTLNPNQFK
jgi:hypothetical protein